MKDGEGKRAHIPGRDDAVQAPTEASAADIQQTGHQLDGYFDRSLALLCVADTEGYFRRLNPAFETALGFSRDELLSEPFIHFVHPQDRVSTLHEFEKLTQGIPTAYFENRYRCKDGSYRCLAWSATPEPGRGLIYATAFDLTEIKRVEQRYQHFFETAPDAMVICDSQGMIALANAACEALFGYSRGEIVGHAVELLVPERLRAKHIEHRRQHASNPRPRPMGGGYELHARRKDGTEFAAEISLSVLRTETDTLTSAAIRDLTERNRTAESLRVNEVELLAAQEIQRHLLPKAPPAIPGYDVAAALYAAEFAAGDHFDYLKMPDGSLGLVVGDVSGHGFAPALLMAATETALRVLVQVHGDISHILRLANQFLFDELEESRFVTVFFGVLDPASRILRYSSAGHPPGFVLDSGGGLKASLESTSVPLGILRKAEFPTAAPVSLDPGDIVLLVTDGVLEAMAPDGSDFGNERALEVVRRNRDRSAREIVELLCRAVRDHAGREKLADDITALVVKVEG